MPLDEELLCPLCGARIRGPHPGDAASDVRRLDRHFMHECPAPGPAGEACSAGVQPARASRTG